ncbi:semaphorin-4E-like [Parambassis ranga]|uniref:Semaphorin-1A n=1 Tax=Parambassis ranga TaxID=210632 RepID=A0A6P7K2C2_9TELE|nr:semaphorin-4E-like [Parambassis ranga]
MHQLLPLCVFWLLPLALMLEDKTQLDCIPRRSVPYHGDNAHLFHEEGVFNYTTMLLREDLNLLVLGAREAVYALDLKDISRKVASVKWEVTKEQKDTCKNKGKDPETECLNYIRILHKTEDDRIYVCGTNAFDPECDYMSYADGNLTLEKKGEDGRGKCPFDPYQRYATIMVGNDLFSATSKNFLGSDPVLMRSSPVSIRTEFKNSWLNDPNFVSMALMPDSKNSLDGDDDKIYLFFSETAVEYDYYNKPVVSRVARVCKGDVGGQRILQKKWTTFLKARMDCPVLGSQLPFIIQETYHWCDPSQNRRDCLFYAIFTSQSDTSDWSAVCAYRVSDINRVFAEGKYKSPVHVEMYFVKWVTYYGDVPVPRPGACINNKAREANIYTTLDLPDRTLQFIKNRPIMDEVVLPVGEKPVLVRRGAKFTSIVVNQVQAADGGKYHVMFIGTEKGSVLKAVNYNGVMFIIEEIQVFEPAKPIKILRISTVTGQIYAGTDFGAAQIPLATCSRSSTCIDCVLSRDPYCGWDKTVGKCVFLSNADSELIQSVKEGNAFLCPDADPVKPVSWVTWPGGTLNLSCPSPSNLAKPRWELDNTSVTPSAHLQLLQHRLLILNVSVSDAGWYRCSAVERSTTDEFTTIVAEYQVTVDIAGSGRGGQLLPQAQTDGPSVTGLQAIVALLVVSLVASLACNFYKGHLPLPWNCGKKNRDQTQGAFDQEAMNSRVIDPEAQRPAKAENKPLVSATHGNGNNYSAEVAFPAVRDETDAPSGNESLQFIDYESEL